MKPKSRTIGVVSAGRADYAICRSILRAIQADPALKLHLIATGMHLSPEFGMTVNAILEDGLEIGDRVEMLVSSDTPEGVAKSMGLGMIGFAQSYARCRPDILVVLADRFEMLAAAAAALPFNIPIAHIEGGDLTEGAIDDAMRHSITKLSHLHFVSTEEYGRRVVQMGEHPWRVLVCGAPSLDNGKDCRLLGRQDLEQKYCLALTPTTLLVTFHPVTLEYSRTAELITELLAALGKYDGPIIFTMPNADTAGRTISNAIRTFINARPSTYLVQNFGTEDYLGIMKYVAAMVGNSSSGLIEAPQFELPVVNIGNRQRGRVRAANVIDVDNNRAEIVSAIRRATQPAFRESLRGLRNPYGTGEASAKIVDRLRSITLDPAVLLTKVFYDLKQYCQNHETK